jgi:hypothetical protein
MLLTFFTVIAVDLVAGPCHVGGGLAVTDL